MLYILQLWNYSDLHNLDLFEGPDGIHIKKERKKFDDILSQHEKGKKREYMAKLKEKYPGKNDWDMFISYLQVEHGFRPVEYEEWGFN